MMRRLQSLTFGCLVIAGGLLPACTEIGEPGDPELEEALNDVPTGALIVRWNRIAVTTISPTNPADAARDLAIVHLAMHDAVNNVGDEFAPYLYDHDDDNADPEVAAAQAAHDVLVWLRPAKQSSLDAELAVDLANAEVEDKKQFGIALGAAVADAYIAARADDGANATVPYTPGSGPGRYQYTPPFTSVLISEFPHVTPFAMASGDQFRPGPPPALDSDEWAAAYNEVKSYGSSSSTTRTQDQTDYARFWIDSAPFAWSRVAQNVATARRKNLWKTARVFALMFAALTDSVIAVADAKFHYDLWRPYTAIRAGDTDGRADTEPDAAWTPLIVTPPFPEYTSGHAALSQAAALVMAETYGMNTAFTLSSPTSVPANQTRSYSSFQAAVNEVSDARVAGGIHYRFACDVGEEQGIAIANLVIDTIGVDD